MSTNFNASFTEMIPSGLCEIKCGHITALLNLQKAKPLNILCRFGCKITFMLFLELYILVIPCRVTRSLRIRNIKQLPPIN